MPSPSTSSRRVADGSSDSDPGDLRSLPDGWPRPVLAVAVLVLAYVEVEATPEWYATWLSVGPVTLPTGVLPPAALAVLVLWGALDVARGPGRPTASATGEALLAGLVVLTAAFAVVTLNTASPGVFWAGVPPLLLGVLLAATVIARDAARALAR